MKNDPLFSNKNLVGRGRGDMPGGRMKWRNLLTACCPRCGYRLVSGATHANATSGRIMSNGTLLCENPHCNFAITAGKANSILADMTAPKRDEESNQAYLNNL